MIRTVLQIRWLCREKSPCSNVYPKASDGVPNYCFKIKFSNSEFVDIESYCIFEVKQKEILNLFIRN